ncbi:MAG TPA: hypothetical protein VHV81_02540 [Steroidobacteraceae bacterium]|nr:hypothetical protein [Steroidobacteraceae bacterium]
MNQLRQGRDGSSASRDEWISVAAELRQLRLRTSSQSRSANAPGTPAPH